MFTLKKPTRPPPPPPIEFPRHRSSHSVTLMSTKGRTSSDYIKISECHSVIPSHQKSRSLTDNYTYLDLELQDKNSGTYKNNSSSSKNNSSIYKKIDHVKTEALTGCIVDRTKPLAQPVQSNKKVRAKGREDQQAFPWIHPILTDISTRD